MPNSSNCFDGYKYESNLRYSDGTFSTSGPGFSQKSADVSGGAEVVTICNFQIKSAEILE